MEISLPRSSRSRRSPAALAAAVLLALWAPAPALATDADGDAVDDRVDLCPQHADPSQADSDGDGYGNACDADYDNDGRVGGADFSRLRLAFGSRRGDEGYDPVLDSNADGAIGAADFSAFRLAFGGPPGPGAAPIELEESPPPDFDGHEEVLLQLEENVDLEPDTKLVVGEQVLGGFDDFSSDSDTTFLTPVEDVMVPINQAQLDLHSVMVREFLTGGLHSTTCPANAPCEFPSIYDTKSEWVYLIWEFPHQTAREKAEQYVAGEDGRLFVLLLNGERLTRAFDMQSPGDFRVWFPVDSLQMVTPIRKSAWYPPGMPWSSWHVAIQLWGGDLVDVPIWGFDPWGTPVYLGSGSLPSEKQGERAAVVVPKPVIKSFFSVTLGATVLSGRCTTCHAMDTEAKIHARHDGLTDGQPITQEPSALSYGETVNHCWNCHEQQLPYLGASSSFGEGIWATPTPTMDIDWGQIIDAHPTTWPAEICSRIVTNLPTPALRAQHFHEDARLFWAVAKGELPSPSGGSLPTAYPSDYGKFIDRFDAWNASGALCP